MKGRSRILSMGGQTFLFPLLSGLCFLPVCFPRHYVVVEEAMTWPDAQRYCREKYTDLASVSSQQQSHQLLAAVQNHELLWIGLYDDIHSWRWSLQDPGYYGVGEADFRKWNKHLNNANGDQTCVMTHTDGTWNDRSCNDRFQFVCYDDSSSSFLVVNQQKTWWDAQSYCRERHTDLASVRNQSENDHIKGLLKKYSSTTYTWIGLRRDSWKWSDGSPYSLRTWDRKRPRSGFNTPCVLLYEGRWRDSSCDIQHHFVCQDDLVKTHVLKVQVTRKDSTVNLEEAAEGILGQLRQTLKQLGLTEDLKLTWRKQPDGKIFSLEQTEKKKQEEIICP